MVESKQNRNSRRVLCVFRQAARGNKVERGETLIVVAAEHFANFFMDNMPAYCIGVGEKHTGPIEDSQWLRIGKKTIKGSPRISYQADEGHAE